MDIDQEVILLTKRRIAKNTGVLLFGNIFNKFCSFVFFIILGRYIGVVGLGKYAFALSFTTVFMTMTDWGFNAIATRDVAADRSLMGKYLGNTLVLKVILSGFF